MRYDKRCKNDEKWSAMACSKSWFSVVLKAQNEFQKTVYTDIKGYEWNMILILNQTAPSLFLLTSNWMLSLWAWTEPGMKSLLSPTNPVRRLYVHRQPKTAVTAARVWWNQMKSACRSQPQHFFLFLNRSSSGSASPSHRSLTQTPQSIRTDESTRKWQKSHFSTPFFFLKSKCSICAACLGGNGDWIYVCERRKENGCVSEHRLKSLKSCLDIR